ncbi:MAG: dihydroxy-acid dehydratase [Desulfobacterales bacterium]|nr:dihydroxy-acid dehydratase [Desulfobacterales bacterium]
MAKAYPFDGLVLIPNCDKIIPGMMMACHEAQHPVHHGERWAHAYRQV